MSYPVHLEVEYPEKLSRGILILRLLLSPLYVGVPHGLCLAVYGILVFFIVVASFFAVLFTGWYPRDLFDLVVGFKRWELRVRAYLMFMTDQYPPFSGKE